MSNLQNLQASEGKPNLQPKKRDSNLELFRIITMLLIVAHHYVVNSGLTAANGPIQADPLSGRSIFLLLFGAWGKTGINCFVHSMSGISPSPTATTAAAPTAPTF